MTATYDFDAVLASVLQADGPQATPPAVVETALASARSVGQRRPLVGALDARAWPAPALSPANPLVTRIAMVALVLLILAGALAFVGASWLFVRHESVFGVFERTGDLPPIADNDRYIDTAAVLADGRILATGMFSSGDPTDTWAFVYDPDAGTWSETGREPEYRQLSTATTLLDGRVLIVGGWRVDTEGAPVLPSIGELYDPATGTFEATRGSLTTPRYSHTATLLADGRVLITGGAGPDFNAAQTETASAEIFDPATGMFSPTGAMSEPRELHAATRLADGRVLITGGMTSRETLATATADVYDPATGTFSRVGSMGIARNSHDAALLADGRVLVVGGSGVGADPTKWIPLSSTEIFDPRTGSFSASAALATERANPGALRLPDGRVLVAGGSNDFGVPHSAELYDPATGRFELAGTSGTGHGGAWLGRLPGGQILVLGRAQDPLTNGVPELWSALDRPTEASDHTDRSANGGFAPVETSTSVLRARHTATLLRDGRILLTGGTDAMDPSAGTLASAELLDPKTGRAQRVDDMSVPRSEHVAVALPDGRVLVAGGEAVDCEPGGGACAWPAPRAEIFDPSTGHFTRLSADLGPGQGNSRVAPPAAALLSDGRVLYVGSNGWTSIIDPVTGDAVRARSNFGSGVASLVPLAGGRILIQAGTDPPGALLFDPITDGVAMVSHEDWDASVALADGRVLVVRETGEAAIFDPATSTFSPTGSMAPRKDHDPTNRYRDAYRRRLTLLRDGRVLVTGGVSDDRWPTPVADADVFDPATGTFRSVGPMLEARSGQSATLLEDGRVAIIGGVARSADRTDPEPVLVEILDPTRLPR